MARALLMCMPDIYQTWHEFHIQGPWLGGTLIAGNCSNHEVFVADLVLKRKDIKSAIDESIALTKPDRIGLSAMTFQYATAIKVAKYIRNKYPDIKIDLGGYHATSIKEEKGKFEDDHLFDIIFGGESEKTYKKLLDGVPLENIPGISFKKNGKWIHNTKHTPIISSPGGIDSISLPKRNSRIWDGYHFHSRKFDTAETSRGCNYPCKFCSIRTMMPDTEWTGFNLDRIVEDLKSIKARGVKSVFFTDDNPAMIVEPFKILLQKIIKEGLNDLRYSGMVSTSSMSSLETTKLMKQAGWDFVFLGIENIYQGNLKNFKKPSSEKLAKRAIYNLYDAGITILAGLIVGSPDDTEEIIRMNFEWFRDKPVDSLMPQFLTPYPGTVMRKELLEEGLVINLGGLDNEFGGWRTYNGEFAHCKTRSGLMPEEIEAIAFEEMTKFKRARIRKILTGQLNITKNNPQFVAKMAFETIKSSLRFNKEKPLTWAEKAKRNRKRKIEMNTFNI
jgi:anaerobic magnesium-protoporphyrin IX monomethyl ester cyclase